MIRAFVDICGMSPFEPSEAMLHFEAVPRVGDTLEVPVDLIGSVETTDHPGFYDWEARPGRKGISLTVQSVYWQPHRGADGKSVMTPVIVTEMVVPESRRRI